MNNAELKGYIKDIPIIDSHFHANYANNIDATVGIFRNVMRYFGYDGICILSLPLLWEKTDYTMNIKALYIKHCLAPNAYAFGGLVHNFDGTDTAESYLAQAKSLYEQGFDGYKMLEGKPFFRKKLGRGIDDPVFWHFYAFAEEKGMPVTLHLADPPHFWHYEKLTPYEKSRCWFCDSTYPTKEEFHKESENIMEKFPRLKLTIAHFAFLAGDREKLSSIMERYKNLSLDLTPNAYEFEDFQKDPKFWKAFFIKYQDRILYGTDTYNIALEERDPEAVYGERINQVKTFVETDREFTAVTQKVNGFALDRKIVENIYGKNFLRRVGGAPAKINFELALKECQRLMALPQCNEQFDLENLATIAKAFGGL